MSDRIERLERLSRLREAGALSDTEFQTEKAKILTASVDAPAVEEMSPGASQASAEDSPVTPLDRAQAGIFAAGLLIAISAVQLGIIGIDALTGRQTSPGITQQQAVTFWAVFNLPLCIMYALLGLSAWRRQRRWVAIVLAILALATAAGSVMQVLAAGGWVSKIFVVLAVGAVWFAIHSVIGSFQLARGVTARRPPRQPWDKQPAGVRERLAYGWEVTRDFRYATRILGLLAIVTVAGIGAYWWFKAEGLPKAAPTQNAVSAPTMTVSSDEAIDPDPAAATGATRTDRSQPPAKMLSEWEVLEGWCRGSSGDDPETHRACDRRDAAVDRLNAAGWCYGREGQINAEYDWHLCQVDSNGAPHS